MKGKIGRKKLKQTLVFISYIGIDRFYYCHITNLSWFVIAVNYHSMFGSTSVFT